MYTILIDFYLFSSFQVRNNQWGLSWSGALFHGDKVMTYKLILLEWEYVLY